MNPNKSQKVNPVFDDALYSPEGSMDLDKNYEMTVAELALQQSKRDQIIAFYLTILGFVIPNVIKLEIGEIPKAVAFLAMYSIGLIFCHVIIRYRIYKEVYWIACRVLIQLNNIRPEGRTKDTIHTLYYNALVKNRDTIVAKNRKGTRNSKWRSFLRQLNSAETLMFETLAIFCSFVGCIGAWYVYMSCPILGGALFVVLVLMILVVNYKYCTRLMNLYTVVDTRDVKDLNIAFSKAWMLHCYVDDIRVQNRAEASAEVAES